MDWTIVKEQQDVCRNNSSVPYILEALGRRIIEHLILFYISFTHLWIQMSNNIILSFPFSTCNSSTFCWLKVKKYFVLDCLTQSLCNVPPSNMFCCCSIYKVSSSCKYLHDKKYLDLHDEKYLGFWDFFSVFQILRRANRLSTVLQGSRSR